MGKDTESTLKFKADISDLQKGITEANRQIKLANSAYKAASDGTKEWSTSSEGLRAKLSQLESVLSGQNQKMAAYKSQLALVSDEYGENSKEATDLKVKINNLQGEINKTNSTIKSTTTQLNGLENASSDAGDEAVDLSKQADKAGDSIEDLGEEADKADGKLKGAFDRIGRGAAALGKTIAAGLAVGVTAMAGLTVKAFQAAGELEQNMGGSEAVFKDAAKGMQDAANAAFSNMGLSASDYLATANKMGALFQGSGMEIEKSADLTSRAMQRAADVASIMGIDVQSAMEAVSGAAKNNYTMMDNLGVAMNETALSAYYASKHIGEASVSLADVEKQSKAVAESQTKLQIAQIKYNDTLKKGGKESSQALSASLALQKAKENLSEAEAKLAVEQRGSIASASDMYKELTSEEKATLAMEMFLDKTAYAAGNYAKENETLSGSLTTAKAALNNFLSGTGDIDGFVNSISGLADVVITKLDDILPSLTSGLSSIIDKLAPKLPGLIQKLLPSLLTGAMALIKGVVSAVPQIMNAVMESLPMIITGLVTMFNELVKALPQIMRTLVAALPALIPQLIDGLVSMILTMVESIDDIIKPIIDALPDILIAIVDGLVRNLPALINGVIQLVIGLVQAIPQIIQKLIEALPTIIELLIDALIENAPLLIMGCIQLVFEIVKAIPQIIMSLIKAVPKIITSIVSKLAEGFPKFIENGKQMLGKIWDGISGAIGGFLKNVGNFFKGIPDNIVKALGNIGKIGKDIIEGFWNGIKDMGKWLMDKIGGFFGGVLDNIKNFFGIKSPSREMAWVGKMLNEGLIQGMGQGLKRVSDMSDRIAEAAVINPSASKFSVPTLSGFQSSQQNDQSALLGSNEQVVTMLQRLIDTVDRKEFKTFLDGRDITRNTNRQNHYAGQQIRQGV